MMTDTAARARLMASLVRSSALLSGGGGGLPPGVGQPLAPHPHHEALIRLLEAKETALAQSQRIAELEDQLMTDELTGLLNRRGFASHFSRVIRGSRGGGRGTDNRGGVVAMIDLDRFKEINDTHGHQAGDAHLVHVARFLMSHIRDHDIAARLGGDEFALVMHGVTARDAERRIADIVAEAGNAPMTWRDETIPIRFSIGVQPYCEGDDPDAVMEEADQRMYTHKLSYRSGERPH